MANEGQNRSSKYFKKTKSVQTSRSLDATLKGVLARLQDRGNLQLLDQRMMSQEALINASWIWMKHVIETDGPAKLEAHLRPAFDRLSVLVAEEMRERGEKDQRNEIRNS